MTQSQQLQSGVDVSLARHGGLSYLEIPAVNVRESAAFYQQVLGWNVHDPDSGQAKFSDQTGHLIGRWITGRAISTEPGLLPYIYVDQIDKATAQVAARGGEMVRSPYREGNLWVATFRDPAGNIIGLWQAG